MRRISLSTRHKQFLHFTSFDLTFDGAIACTKQQPDANLKLGNTHLAIMRSHSSSSSSSANLYRLGFLRPPTLIISSHSTSSPSSSPPFQFSSSLRSRFSSNFSLKVLGPKIRVNAFSSRHRLVSIAAMDEDLVASFSLDDREDSDGSVAYAFSSSEGEESDRDMILNPITDVDLPTVRERFRQTDDALTVTAHELVVLGRTQKKSRIKYGVFINMGLVTFLTVLILLVDCCAWRIVRLPLPPFHLMRPFSTSAVLVSCAGYICVPLFRRLKMQIVIRRRPVRHSSKKGTPTMGGLFLIPIGIVVAEVIVGFSSVEVSGAAAATLAFAAIGLLHDFLSLTKSRNNGVVSWMRILLEVAVGIWFSVWLFTTNISSPYSMYTFL